VNPKDNLQDLPPSILEFEPPSPVVKSTIQFTLLDFHKTRLSVLGISSIGLLPLSDPILDIVSSWKDIVKEQLLPSTLYLNSLEQALTLSRVSF
jgi:hypothetical protein